jgi:hypothetical protein
LQERRRHHDHDIDILVGSTRIESTQMFIHAIVAFANVANIFASQRARPDRNVRIGAKMIACETSRSSACS